MIGNLGAGGVEQQEALRKLQTLGRYPPNLLLLDNHSVLVAFVGRDDIAEATRFFRRVQT